MKHRFNSHAKFVKALVFFLLFSSKFNENLKHGTIIENKRIVLSINIAFPYRGKISSIVLYPIKRYYAFFCFIFSISHCT